MQTYHGKVKSLSYLPRPIKKIAQLKFLVVKNWKSQLNFENEQEGGWDNRLAKTSK